MKQLLLSLIALAFAGITTAQISPCTELFFSEYVEGTGNNKALEIYNPTNQPVSLNDYRMSRYDNGSTSPNYVSFPAGTTVPARGVLVVVLDKRDPNGTGNEVPVDPALQALADIFLCPVYTVNKMMYFNGNDAVSLERFSNGAIVDMIGKIGQDPGYGWNDDEDAGFMQTEFWDPNHWTYNNTMVRKRSVKKGMENIPASFNPSVEWDTLGVNVFDSLRSHTCDCNISNIQNPNSVQPLLVMYPNPVVNQAITLQSSKTIGRVEIFNVIGQHILTVNYDGSMAKVQVDLRGMNSGLYIAKVSYTDNTSTTRKFQIR
jgi:hypothetical protein